MSDNINYQGSLDSALETRSFRIDVDAECVADQLLQQIEQTMTARGINQTELADLMECSPSNVSQILHGEGTFNLRTMVSLADALGCKLTVKMCSNYTRAASYSLDDHQNLIDFPEDVSEIRGFMPWIGRQATGGR